MTTAVVPPTTTARRRHSILFAVDAEVGGAPSKEGRKRRLTWTGQGLGQLCEFDREHRQGCGYRLGTSAGMWVSSTWTTAECSPRLVGVSWNSGPPRPDCT